MDLRLGTKIREIKGDKLNIFSFACANKSFKRNIAPVIPTRLEFHRITDYQIYA